jgi:hypothetical protein
LAAKGFEVNMQLADFQPDLFWTSMPDLDSLEVYRSVKMNTWSSCCALRRIEAKGVGLEAVLGAIRLLGTGSKEREAPVWVLTALKMPENFKVGYPQRILFA